MIHKELSVHTYLRGERLPDDFIRLYTEAFPQEERRDWTVNADAERWAGNHKDFNILLLYYGSRFIGFLNYWTLHYKNADCSDASINYIEHLAVNPDVRNLGAGSYVIREFFNLSPGGVILEVEPPDTELAARRINLYRRLGCVLHKDIEYIQPPYFQGNKPISLLLMTSPDIQSELISNNIVPVLKWTVYGQ